MDQIFERFERLVRSWVNSAVDGADQYRTARRPSSSGDPDLDAAMSELDDFLDLSKTETERREAAERRAAEDRARRERERARTSSGGYSGGWTGSRNGAADESGATEAQRRQALAEAYRYLGVPDGAPFPEVKTAYKKLLLKYHPDRNSQTPEALRAATERSTRINAAYQLIEAWEEARARPR